MEQWVRSGRPANARCVTEELPCSSLTLNEEDDDEDDNDDDDDDEEEEEDDDDPLTGVLCHLCAGHTV